MFHPLGFDSFSLSYSILKRRGVLVAYGSNAKTRNQSGEIWLSPFLAVICYGVTCAVICGKRRESTA